MSKPARKHFPKNKPLPQAPSKALPSAPPKPNKTKPRSNTLESTQTYTFQTNLNGTYTTTNGSSTGTGTGTGFTYTTTYYTTSSHAWSKPSKPLKKIPNKTKTPPSTTITYYNMPPNNNYTTTYNTTTTTRKARANTLDHLQMQTHEKHQKHPSYHNALPLNPTIVNLDMEYSINDEVDLNDNRQGTIRFIGEIAVELNGAIWYGIQLKKPQGNNNGTLKGISYFKCTDHYGTFVEKKHIRWLTSTTDIQAIDLEASSRLHINQVVRIKGKKGKGQIRFIGLYNGALKYGIELLNDMGVHSGVVDDKFFFTCGIYRGMFVDRNDILQLEHYEEEKHSHSLHNRTQHELFSDLPTFDDGDGDSDDSDESVSSVGTLMTVDDDVFDRIQLNEREADMAFTQLLNKFKNVERTQPRPSKLDMTIDAKKLLEIIGQNDETLPQENSLSLNISETSPIEDRETCYKTHTYSDSVGAELDDEYNISEPPPTYQPKKMSIIVGMHTPNGTKLKNQTKPDDILANIQEEVEHHKPEIPSMIQTEPQPEPIPMSDDNNNNNNINVQKPSALTSLSPLGLFSPDPGHSPQVSLNLDDFVNISPEDSHLKEIPDSPYDINTTQREFANTANVIQLGSNNPSKLFKILRTMTIKLFQENMKYRILSSKSNRIRAKLLNFDGVLEFLNQLGFKENDEKDKLECALDQPPLSVLDSAIMVCSDFITKCSRRRAVIDTIKRFNPTHAQILNDSDLATLQIESEKEEEKSQTPFETVSKAELKLITPKLTLSNHPSSAEQEQIAIDKTLDVVYEGDDDEVQTEKEKKEEIEEEIEFEELADTFKLYEIIASITTHEDNKDNSARQIILLCYTTFTDSVQMFNCLDRRFFEAEKLSTYNEKFKWVIQTKVITFIQSWIRQYWVEDWANPVSVLLDCVEKLFVKIKEKNEKQNKKYFKFIEMVEKTMHSQDQGRNLPKKRSQSERFDMLPLNDGRDNSVIEQAFSDKVYDFFKLNNSKIARQITYLDMTYFGAIKARECLGQAWKKKNKYDIAYNICQFIDHFNRIAKWVQARVLLSRNVKKRGKMIKKFIKICEQLFILRNFQSLYAIYGALYSSAIIRLKKAWHYVPTKHLAKFEEFKVIFSTKKNMANLRKLHRETYPPMIPYTGIFLQDLLSIEEGNKQRKDDGAVNFARLLRLSTVIDSILLHQKTTYKIMCDAKLQLLITNELKLNQNLSEDLIWKLSDKMKKTDSRKNNFMKFGAK